VPAVAMQFTDQVDWGAVDFAAAGGLLFGAGTAMVVAVRHIARMPARIVVLGGIVLVVMLAWAELSVGLFR